jgi:diadenosine tetraphosphate (Ap4A) HIT family hydrolase
MPYDPHNVFAQILRGELPCTKVYEDTHALAFHDRAPVAPVHVLVIPKGPYVSLDDFIAAAPAPLQAGFWACIPKIVRLLGIAESGYRILSNHGRHANQMVPHCHVHILGGTPLGGLVPPASV